MIIPPPPLDQDQILATSSTVLEAAIHRGVFGICIMCHQTCYDWLDLTEVEMEPVTDDQGHLTDQVALHPRHVVALLEHWATVLYGDLDDSEPTPEPVVRVASTPAQGPRGAYARRMAGAR